MEPSNMTKSVSSNGTVTVWTPQSGMCIQLHGIYIQVDTDDTVVKLIRGSVDQVQFYIRKGTFKATGGMDTMINPLDLNRNEPITAIVAGGTAQITLQGKEHP